MTKSNRRGISRRSFLTGAGVLTLGAAAAGIAGCAPSSETSSTTSSEAEVSAEASSQAAEVAEPTVTSEAIVTPLNPQDYDYTTNSIDDFTQTTLFSPWQLGPLNLSHRMVKSAAMQLAFMANNPDEFINYYKRMADGGVEMIWIEDFANNWDFCNSPFRHPYAEIDVKGLLDALHEAGAYVGTQFDTMGSPIGPLAYTEPFIGEYSTDEIKQWEQEIINLGIKLHNDGFDAYELNFAANNVGQSFFSRLRNTRTDEYGPQNMENRTRFAVECIKGIKEACGDDFVVQVLINGVEANDQVLGNDSKVSSVEEMKEIAKILEDAGADSLHVRIGPSGAHIAQFAGELYFAPRGLEGATSFGGQFDFDKHFQGLVRGNHSGCGLAIDVAAEIKSAVNIPVGAATYMDPAQAPDYFEEALSEGKLDFLVMNRPLCVDPEYVNKLRDGRIDEIAPCTRCLHCFYDPDKANTLLEHCRVNAANWRAYGPSMPEGFAPAPAETAKAVMVVGGGPAGMEAARVAAERGHNVTLYEKNAMLGGLLADAEAIKGPHENLGRLSTYLQKQLEVNGVDVVTGQEVDADFVAEQAPDVVIVATGGVRPEPEFESTSGTQVLGFSDVMGDAVGDNVVVLGSNAQAVDTTLFLVSEGKKVDIVTPDPIEQFEKGHSVNMREFVETSLNAAGVRVWPAAKVDSVDDGSITFTSEAGVEITIDCDTVIDVSDMLPNTELTDAIKDIDVIAVGDCNDPFNISEAIAAGNLAARSI